MESKDYIIRKTYPLDRPEMKTKLKYPSTVSEKQKHLRNYPVQKNSPISFIRVKPNEFHKISNKNNTKTSNNIKMIGKSIKPTYRVVLLNKNPSNITTNFQSQVIKSANEISKYDQKYDIENNITLKHNQLANEFYKKENSEVYKEINGPNFEKVEHQAAHNSNILNRAGKLKFKINKKLINEITNLPGSTTQGTEIYNKQKEFQKDASNSTLINNSIIQASNLYNNRNDDDNNNVMQEINIQNIHRTVSADDSGRKIIKAKEKSVVEEDSRAEKAPLKYSIIKKDSRSTKFQTAMNKLQAKQDRFILPCIKVSRFRKPKVQIYPVSLSIRDQYTNLQPKNFSNEDFTPKRQFKYKETKCEPANFKQDQNDFNSIQKAERNQLSLHSDNIHCGHIDNSEKTDQDLEVEGKWGKHYKIVQSDKLFVN
ncbi:hypothetical protein K1T71_013899 [Dendrolimus kikuchii]|uniref:Uncharacterized protein n=1 Tax=Dendrolimus kikuchii TaxID=765133 RepID=A0ACC1CG24_9NEOP|nr:hypothetical protein K1T71_013899 [Dendrolimus kikuchii]